MGQVPQHSRSLDDISVELKSRFIAHDWEADRHDSSMAGAKAARLALHARLP
jgi:hypothetical protein